MGGARTITITGPDADRTDGMRFGGGEEQGMLELDEIEVATVRWRGAAQVQNIAAARGGVLAFAEAHGVAETTRRDMGVAVEEVLTNAVRHAYDADEIGDLEVDAATDGECLTVRIADHGRGVTGESVGLGLQLVRGMADRTEVGPAWGQEGGTVVTMEFLVGGRPTL